MTPNQKLTRVLSGKTVTEVHAADARSVTVRFGDGTTMTVQGALAAPPTPPAPPAAPGAPGATPTPEPTKPVKEEVKMIRESGDSLVIELDGGDTLRFTLDDPGGSVLVRDSANTVRYAG